MPTERSADSAARQIARIAVAPLTVEAFCGRTLQWAAERSGPPKIITYLNAHNLNVVFDNPEYGASLCEADLVYADGMGVVWGWRWLGRLVPERVNAGDFILDFCRRAAERKLSLYLIGSRPGVARKAAQRWAAEAPGLVIAGARDGYFPPEREAEIAEEIHRAAPSIVLAGMGVPRQELWTRRWAGAIGAPVVWCVGALFEYYAGERSRAPRWMRRCGLEWTWRLALEPGRLSGRYLAGNVRFLANLRKMRKAQGSGPGNGAGPNA